MRSVIIFALSFAGAFILFRIWRYMRERKGR